MWEQRQNWSDISTCQRMSRTVSKYQKLEEAGKFLFYSSHREHGPASWFQTSNLQDCEMIIFWCFMSAAASTTVRDQNWLMHSLRKTKLKTSWVESPIPQSHNTFYWCLGKQKVSVVLQWSHQPPVSPVTSPILLIALNHLCYFLVHRHTYALGKHLRVCTVFWTYADPAFQGPHYVFP